MDIIAWLKAAVLGLVEGITEFIPVSSTGHLILTQQVLGFHGEKENAFVIFIQFGAILAVVWLYRRKFLDLALHWRQPRQRQLILNLIIATLPAVAVGLPTENWIEAHFFRPLPVALALVGGGLAILALEARRRTVRGGDGGRDPLAAGVGRGCHPGAVDHLPRRFALRRDHHGRARVWLFADRGDRVLVLPRRAGHAGGHRHQDDRRAGPDHAGRPAAVRDRFRGRLRVGA